jgi:hypothetical protein
MEEIATQLIRPTKPPGRSGPLDRTAGGIGGVAPASLDLYGQSRTTLIDEIAPGQWLRYPWPFERLVTDSFVPYTWISSHKKA